MSGTRGLTEGEIELAKSVYGDTIDYTKVEIHDHSYMPGVDIVQAPNGDIYYPESQYQDDFSTGGLSGRKTFIHEMGHVLQDQNGINVARRVIRENVLGGHPRGDYDWTDKFESGTSFHEWDLEEQAQFFGDLYRAREDGTTPAGVTKTEMETFFDSLDLKRNTHLAENSNGSSIENEVRFAGENSNAANQDDAIAGNSTAGQIPMRDVINMLDADHRIVDATFQGGTPSPAHQAITHPDSRELFKSLVENGVESLTVEISPDMDPEARIEALLMAGVDAARAVGISPSARATDAGVQITNHDMERSHMPAEDSYEYDL